MEKRRRFQHFTTAKTLSVALIYIICSPFQSQLLCPINTKFENWLFLVQYSLFSLWFRFNLGTFIATKLIICSFSKTNYELNVFPYTQLHIVCPNTWTVLKTWKHQVPQTDLYENIWGVDESGYKTCSTGKAASQPALILCDSPTQVKFDTFVFRFPANSPTTFAPGKEYFFIGKRL